MDCRRLDPGPLDSRAAVAKDRNVKVVVRGDKQVKYRTVAEILGLIQLADLWNIHFASGKE